MITLLIALIIVTIAVVAVYFIKDRRFLKSRTVESLGEKLWEDIDKERSDSIEKGKKFRRELDKAMKGK